MSFWDVPNDIIILYKHNYDLNYAVYYATLNTGILINEVILMEVRNQRTNMPDIRPVTDLRARSAEIARLVNDENTPVILTKNGYASMVVLSYAEYTRLNTREELYRLLAEAEEDVATDRLYNLDDVVKEMREDIANGKL